MVEKKVSKKSFFDVKAPLTSTKVSLYAASMEELEGKVVKLDLTRSLRGKSMELKLKIRKGAEGLVAEPVSLQVVGSYIRKMIRGGTDYVEDSFVAECKDTKVLVKPFMITRKKVSRAIRNDLRHTAKVHLENHFKVRTSGEIFTELLMNKIQKDLSLRLKKVYPLALCEIRIFEIVNEKK